MLFASKKTQMVTKEEALPGSSLPIQTAERHHVNKQPITGPVPHGLEEAFFALGCFWGAERKFWQTPGVVFTAVGYQGGFTPNPTYEQVCSGRTGHTEIVRIVFDPLKTSFTKLLAVFWESHDPTQGMRQGNDLGTQYRSAIYAANPQQLIAAQESKRVYEAALRAKGFGTITTEIAPAGPFYYAEDYHQQYLSKNPGGYCGIGGTGVACPIGVGVTA